MIFDIGDGTTASIYVVIVELQDNLGYVQKQHSRKDHTNRNRTRNVFADEFGEYFTVGVYFCSIAEWVKCFCLELTHNLKHW